LGIRKRISKALRAALAKSAEFTGRPPKRIRKISIKWPESLVAIGPCAQVDYISNKFDGKYRRYFHEFEGDAFIFAAPDPQKDGRNMLVIVGDFTIEADGIIG
jgi:hypothetical protein